MRNFLILMLIPCCISCDWAGNKAKETVHKSGEVVGKAGTEFVNGLEKGVEKSLAFQISLSEDLKKQGLTTGKITLSNANEGKDNVLNTYFIFTQNFNRKVLLKVLDENNQEYGRAQLQVTGQKDGAGYFDFVFDKRTNIDGKSKLIFE